jgi:ATP-dependent protease ClpP protease subunit
MANEFMERVFSSKKKELLIYIHSGGGSVFSMNRIISTMRASGKTFTCIARFAASAAFMIFEHCDNRYVMEDSILMSHNASGGFYGEFPRIRTQLTLWEKIVEKSERTIAKKMGMKYEDYKTEINKEMWMEYTTALQRKAADVLVGAYCTKATVEKLITKSVETCGLFECKTDYVTVSACPLISEPKSKASSEENNGYDIYDIH